MKIDFIGAGISDANEFSNPKNIPQGSMGKRIIGYRYRERYNVNEVKIAETLLFENIYLQELI